MDSSIDSQPHSPTHPPNPSHLSSHDTTHPPIPTTSKRPPSSPSSPPAARTPSLRLPATLPRTPPVPPFAVEPEHSSPPRESRRNSHPPERKPGWRERNLLARQVAGPRRRWSVLEASSADGHERLWRKEMHRRDLMDDSAKEPRDTARCANRMWRKGQCRMEEAKFAKAPATCQYEKATQSQGQRNATPRKIHREMSPPRLDWTAPGNSDRRSTRKSPHSMEHVQVFSRFHLVCDI